MTYIIQNRVNQIVSECSAVSSLDDADLGKSFYIMFKYKRFTVQCKVLKHLKKKRF